MSALEALAFAVAHEHPLSPDVDQCNLMTKLCRSHAFGTVPTRHRSFLLYKRPFVSPVCTSAQVKKTAFAEGIRCVSLGSRKTLCGNEAVSKLKSDVRMADACLELQKNKKKGKKTAKKAKPGINKGVPEYVEKRGIEIGIDYKHKKT